MKCKLCKDMPAVAPEKWPKGQVDPSELPGICETGVIPEGTVLNQPGAYKFVRLGIADPEDEECRIAAGLSDPQILLAKMRQRRVSAGVAPEDYDAFDKGIMVGYNPDGTFKPGPNFEEAEWQERKETSPIIIEDE
jgi:hypothetical protein